MPVWEDQIVSCVVRQSALSTGYTVGFKFPHRMTWERGQCSHLFPSDPLPRLVLHVLQAAQTKHT